LDKHAIQDREQDAELVRRVAEGKAEAFELLVRRYHRRVIGVAYRLLGNSEDAQDVSQEAFVRAFRSLDTLDDPARFGGWLIRIVSNQALNFRRARSLRTAASLDDLGQMGDGAARRPSQRSLPGRSDEADATAPGELHDAISAAMEELPEQQRLALILFSVEGMPQKDVAEVLECSIEMVKWNVFQARKRMKEKLAEFLA